MDIKSFNIFVVFVIDIFDRFLGSSISPLLTLNFHFQLFMFYGPRSNGEFFVHNGFVYAENDHDRLSLKLGEHFSNQE